MATELMTGSCHLASKGAGYFASDGCLSNENQSHLFDFHSASWINWDDESFDSSSNALFATSFHDFLDSMPSTSTPNSARTVGLKECDSADSSDSGFVDSYSSDGAVLQMSHLYLSDDLSYEKRQSLEESSLPKLCLVSKFDEESDTDASENSSSSNAFHLPVSWTVYPNTESADGSRERLSSRRQRSPVPVIERRARHRLSLDAFFEFNPEQLEVEQISRRFSDSFALQCFPSSLEPDAPAEVIHEVEEIVSRNEPVETFDDRLQSVLARYAPPCLSQLIGRKMGLDHVDIIGELMDRSMIVIVGKIAVYLPGSDLCKMSVVSRKWHAAIHCHKISRERKIAYISTSRNSSDLVKKENLSNTCRSSRNRTVRRAAVTRDPLACVQHPDNDFVVSSTRRIQQSNAGGLASQFWEEAQKLRNDERLTKCPRCSGPSKSDSVQQRARCTAKNCRYDFCTRCTASFHGSSDCISTLNSSTIHSDLRIGSRKSHRNLRRL